ncbi:hypothetical protein HNQ74_001262 [Bartonella doshiae]|uniref:Transposase n=1 Tax=Bartonella doshiae NCTC 12862 = ATCC 700133 TaxID=1094553 RepID=A0ABN0GGY5_BARDO|nr:hypothetical protein MCS_00901 [Bartonella doshiae NCTC 12862 = ATCC 700133]MBB6159822.1 hypothetical protein [Bartonella doshiae]
MVKKERHYKSFKISYASLKIWHSGYFADDSVKKIVYRSNMSEGALLSLSFFCGRVQTANFRTCRRRGKKPIISQALRTVKGERQIWKVGMIRAEGVSESSFRESLRFVTEGCIDGHIVWFLARLWRYYGHTTRI